LRACLLAALPNRAFLAPCERDARAPSTRDAGNAGVPPAIPTAREKTYPFKLPQRGRGAGGEGEKACTPCTQYPSPTAWERRNAQQGAPPCAPTPLAHSVGEGLGVRAKKRARPAHSEPKRCTLIREDTGGEGNPPRQGCSRAKSAGIPLCAVEPYPNILGGNAWTLASYTYICTQSLAY